MLSSNKTKIPPCAFNIHNLVSPYQQTPPSSCQGLEDLAPGASGEWLPCLVLLLSFLLLVFFLLLLCGLPKSALPRACAMQKTTVAAFVVVVVVAVVVGVDDDVVDGFCFRLLASGSCIQNHFACAVPPLARPCGKLALPKQHANSLNCLGSAEENNCL